MLQFGYKYCALFRSSYSKFFVDIRVLRFVHAIKLLLEVRGAKTEIYPQYVFKKTANENS